MRFLRPVMTMLALVAFAIGAASAKEVFFQNEQYTIQPVTTSSGIPCLGDACSVATISWTGHGYIVHNAGHRKAKVTVQWVWEFTCMGPLVLHLAPGDTVNRPNTPLCIPYHSNFE